MESLAFHDINRGLPYLRLLEALPNLVSLSLNISGYCASVELPRVVLKSLNSLTLELCCEGMILKSLHVPSLEHLALDVTYCFDFTESMDAFCDSLFQLRHLTLRNIETGPCFVEPSEPSRNAYYQHILSYR